MKKNLKILNEFEGASLLRQSGIPVIDGILAHTDAEAAEAAGRLGFPVALKICSEAVPHKTERGGVSLNIKDTAALERAVREMKKRFPDIPFALLVQKMARPGTELILGCRRDPVFGPIVLAGIGGIFTEIFRDSVIELAPVDEEDAPAMLRRLKGVALLDGYRSREPLDVAAIAKSLSALSRLIADRPDIAEIDINPFIAYPQGAVAVDALVRLDGASPAPARKRPSPATIAPFFQPSSMAVIGASRSPGKGGNIILRNLQKAGFKGALYPINPTVKEILGLPSYARVSDVPGKVETAMVVIPKTAVPDALEDCAAKGVTNIILSTGGYSDAGEEGAREQKTIIEMARRAGIRIMGPNSIGTLNPSAGMSTSIVGLDPIRKGGVSIIGQSGVFSSGWARWIADTKPFGLAKVACIGNKGDVNESDLLEYLTGDSATRTVGMYLEGVVEGKRFIRAAAAACKAKPVVVMKAGRSEAGAAAVASHTGSLAGSDAVFDAVCRRTGLVRTQNSEAFFDALAAFEKLPLPRGNRMGALSITGMGCVAATDAVEECGIDLPALQPDTLRKLREVMPVWAPVRNPIDIWSAIEQHGSKKATSHIARCLMEQPDVDALLITFVLMSESMFDIPEAFADIFRRHPHKPVFASYYGGTAREIAHIHEGFAALGVPCYPTPERAIFAFSRMVEYARFRGVIGK
ncbi:MAG TPA: acetate--CoA ligase family protein [Smithellaceae bacterium]|nr:acetate--CoA ligase family protein [Smithellaceae bacterium]HNY96211.1 acetate--CoA ligase family protein [Smithellaceae bacterium]HOD63059.1 acetate--CoA ligase family protein [Smithellaceae bacterium]HOE22001.1 acetate--CoA ligase family protein [Smithellaceae bacterium]HOH57020.1 acetate--CoA ligase family protein [Smithellaceae bacterium]